MATSGDGLERALHGNRRFVQETNNRDPTFFNRLAEGQSPEILWLGCSDSRVPETTICHCHPGDIFVHRNIANCMHASDISAASVIEYAVAHLKVKKIVICGHTKCGGAAAALGDADLGEVLNTWLLQVRELRRKHQAELDALVDNDAKGIRLAELNVHQGLEILQQNPTVKSAMNDRGLTVHGFIFDIATGQLRELGEKKSTSGLWSPQ